jgi:predicted metalloprotease with PDZ domain
MNTAPHTTIRIVDPHTHLIDVSISVVSSTTMVTLRMPVWTPGSYMVREYARHVRDVGAMVGDVAVPIKKIDKRSWVAPCQPGDVVTVHYRVYAYDLTVRTNHVDDSHAFFNPAAVVMQVDAYTGSLPLSVEVPHHWAVATQLDLVQQTTLHGDGTRWDYVASDYDALYDAPFEIGTHRRAELFIADVLHEVVIWGSGNEDWPALVRDIERCTRAVQAHFRTIPYTRYTFILHLADGAYGGLEHCNSTVCLVDRWGFKRLRDYEKILGLITHEFYHTWNVKRIRPAPLGPFAYGTENYTRMLWLAEGVTSYYDNLILCRAGIISHTRYLELLADDLRTVRRHPGSAVQSLSDASFDAWIRYYRPDENSNNVSVSYYIKGAVAAFLLDMYIRRWSDGTRSLDDVMHVLEQRYRLDAPGIPEDDTMQALITEVVGGHRAAIDQFFAQVINGTDYLAYSDACAVVGLTDAWFSGDDPLCTIGVTLRQDQQRCLITQVRSGSAAEAAGIAPFDELLALDGSRIDAPRWKARMAEYQPGTTVTIHTFRRDELRITHVQLDTAPLDKMELRSVAYPSGEQAAQYAQWLRMPTESEG